MKRVPELRDLSDDHHTALVLARRCRQAGRGAAEAAGPVWRLVREVFGAHLAPHFRIEEEHLLPGLRAIGEAALAERIREDHTALRELVGAGGEGAESLARFGALLEAHVRFEEREVFEPTQHRLPEDALRAVASACAEIPRSCPTSLVRDEPGAAAAR